MWEKLICKIFGHALPNSKVASFQEIGGQFHWQCPRCHERVTSKERK